MGRLIIDFDDSLSAVQVLIRVRRVVEEGRVSKAGGVMHYCWVTTFGDGIHVSVRRKKRGQKSDSFTVWQGS